MRRSWLIANGCAESTIDAPPPAAPAQVAVVPPPATPLPPAPAAPPPPAPEAEAPSPTPPPARPVVSEPAPAPPRPAPDAEPATTAAPPPRPDTDRANGAFSDRDRTETRTQRLRDIISSHRPEMKSCVDRQLKLAPDLKAEGTLVIDVEKDGTVPSAALVGAELAGTPLEACLRTAAARWRFPASARAYKISAPVKVWGSGMAR